MKIVDNRTLETKLSLDPVEEAMGIVIGDRDETGKNTIKVYIPRFMQGIEIEEGKPLDEDGSITGSKLLNSQNKSIGSSSIKLKNYIEVPPFVIPNMNPPRYVVGERVLINFIDKDIKSPIYFPFQVHDVIKRQVDVSRFFVPAKEKEDDPLINENSYYVELNSRDKFVRLFTSNKNGEKCPFTVNFDTENGIFTFKDDTENRLFEWNYDEDKLLFQTDAGLVVEFKEQAALIKCETLDLEATESMKIKTSKLKIEADQADILFDNMYVKNTSYEHEATSAKLKYNMSECSGQLWKIASPGLFLDAPATIHTGVSIFAGFAITNAPAPPDTPSMYSGGALDGASPSSSSQPSSQQPDSGAPASNASGSKSSTDMVGNGKGKPLAYAEPVIELLKEISKQADKALGVATYHMHPGEYKPLAMNPVSPAVNKPLFMLEMTTQTKVMSKSMDIKANDFKA